MWTNESDFGWLWIARSLRLRRLQAVTALALIAAGYGSNLVFPIATQRIVDAIIARNADVTLVAFALLAIIAIILDAIVSLYRQRNLDNLGQFLVRRVSRRVFAHLLRVRTDGGQFKAGDIINYFDHLNQIR